MKANVGLFLAKRARLNARAEAVVEVERGRRFTYAQLNRRCNRIANELSRKGIRKGDRVALLMMNGVEYVESFFAIAKIGAVVVPLNWRLLAGDLAFIVADSGAVALLYDGEFDANVETLHAADTMVRCWIRSAATGRCPGWAADYADLMASGSDVEPVVSAEGADNLFIMYTSGTTGLPKGVIHTHETTLWGSLTLNMTCDIRDSDTYLQVMPLFHVGALTPAIALIHRGGTLVIMRAFDPHRVFDVFEQERCDTSLLVPAMLQMMWQSPRRAEADLSRVRWILSGAAPVPVSVIRDYAGIGIEIHQVYGLTESCGPACVISAADAMSKAGSAGPAFFHTEVRVVDEHGVDVATGEAGEIIVSGPHLMTGYWNRPDATAESLRDGWLYTGDIATMDEDGFCYIQDRKKDMIISGGENIYPAEIEKVLTGHPEVLECAVIGQPSPKWGEAPLAIVSLKPGATTSATDIIDYCSERLARFKLPKAVEFSADIPRNPSGKILKRVLRERYPGPAPE